MSRLTLKAMQTAAKRLGCRLVKTPVPFDGKPYIVVWSNAHPGSFWTAASGHRSTFRTLEAVRTALTQELESRHPELLKP